MKLRCADCGKDLKTEVDVKNLPAELEVEPCTTCLEDKYDEGRQDGDNYDEGYDAGFRDGQAECK